MATKKKEEKLESFSTGSAVRENKEGKGRSDLMANEILSDVLAYAVANYFTKNDGSFETSFAKAYMALHSEKYPDMYYDTIINMVCFQYAFPTKSEIINGENVHTITLEEFVVGMSEMSLDLAKHYENGAVKHGIDNWKKGIPVIGGERGGSCNDSARRHGDKYLAGYDDENHPIACIWNCVTALYMIKHADEYK